MFDYSPYMKRLPIGRFPSGRHKVMTSIRLAEDGDLPVIPPEIAEGMMRDPNWWELPGLGAVTLGTDPVPVYPSEFTEFGIMMPDKINHTTSNFSFDGREYLLRPYDTSFKRVLLKFGRQCEKCCEESTYVTLHDGRRVQLKDIEVGDSVVSMDPNTDLMTVGEVSWKSDRIRKTCVTIRTRKGDEITVATTHPMLQINSWTDGGLLKPKDRIGTARLAGGFTSSTSLYGWEDEDLVAFAAYMIGDGCCGGTKTSFSFSQKSEFP